MIISVRESKTHSTLHSFISFSKLKNTYTHSIPIKQIINLQHSKFSPTAPSNTILENPTEIYDTDIQRQELEKGMYLEKILKGKLNVQQRTKNSCFGNNNQRNIQKTNTEIGQTNLLIHENKRGNI